MKKIIITCFILLSGIHHAYAGDIVVTTTGNVDEIIGNAIALTDAATGAPEASSASNSTTNSITTNITTLTNNAWVIDVVGSSLNGSFTPGGSQTEQTDQQTGTTGNQRAQGSAASSTQTVVTAGLTSMSQTHTSGAGTNDLVHALAAVAPTATIAVESTSTGNISTNNNNTLTWTHNFNDSNIDNKLMVGVIVEDRTNACTTGTTLSGQSVEISSITHDGTNLTRTAYQTIRIPIGGQDRCLRAELWYLDIDVPSAPLAEWRMDEGSWSGTAGEVADNTGNGYDGTAVNGSVTDNTSPALATDPGTCGYGVFDGTNDYASVTNLSSILNGTASLAFWINTTQSGNNLGWQAPGVTGVEEAGGSDDIFWGWIDASGNIGISVGNDYSSKSSTAINDGNWHHVVLTRNASSGAFTIYIDGVLNTSGTIGAGTIGNTYTSIGRIEDTGGSPVYFNGLLDELRVYSSVLSSGEVTTVMNETHTCPASNDITVNFSTNINAINAGSISITDAAIGDPEASNTNTNTTTAAITTLISTLTDNAWLIDIAGSGNGGTFSPGVGQTERWDTNIGSATAAMTTKEVATAAADSMTQTHSTTSNRNAQVAISIAPIDSSSTIGFDAAASTNGTNANTISWSHTLSTLNTSNTKLIVGIGFEETGTCNDTIDSVTYGNIPLTFIARAQVASGACQQVEIWYADLTNIIVSTNNNSTLGGQAIDQDEAVEYDAVNDTGSLFLDDATIFTANTRLDALHALSNGNVALSTSGNAGATIDGTSFEEDDVVEVTTGGTFVQYLFQESNFTSAEDNNRDVDAVYVRENGNLILSTAANEQLPLCGGGSLNFVDNDLIEWDTSSNCATMFLDESTVGAGDLLPNATGDEDIVGVHLLNDNSNLVLFSILNNNTLRGTAVLDGDVVLYNVSADTVSIYFSESNFTSGDEDVDALTLAVPPFTGSTLQNFVITVSATASTCTSTEVTIEARDTTNSIFDYDGTITLTTSTTASASSPNGTWDEVDHNSALSASNPANNTVADATADDGTATYLFSGASDGGRVGLFLFNQHAEALTVTVEDTTVAGSSTTSSNITFSDNVFEITPTTCTGSTCPGTGSYEVVAGRNHVFQVDMVRNDGTSCGVATGYNNAAQTLEGWIVRDGDDPTGTLTTLAEQTAALGDGANPGADNVTLDFSGSGGGTATLTLQTSDVGKFELFLRDTTNNFAAVDIDGSTGASNPITVRPFGLGFRAITGLVANPAASTPGGTRFTTAGSNYSAFVGGYLYDSADDIGGDGVPDTNRDVADNGNTLTSSYAWDTDIIAVLNTPTSGQGGILGTFSFTTPNGGSGLIGQLDFAGGEEQVTDFTYFEVGSIRMQADAIDYLNTTGVSVAGTSNVVGRFGADQFTFTISGTPTLGEGCSGFTYVDQSFDYSAAPLITARATAADGTTVLSNYADLTGAGGDNWWLLPLTPFASGSGVATNYSDLATPTDISLDSITSDYSPNTGTTGAAGTQLFTLTGPFSYTKNTSPISLQGPFDTDIRLDFSVTDSDSATGTYVLSTDATIPPDVTITFSNPEQRWGRMSIGTAVGSELLTLSPSIIFEYYDGSGFVQNTLDTCTNLDLIDHIRLDNTGSTVAGNSVMTIGSGTTTINNFDSPPVATTEGDTQTIFSAPGAGNTGYVDIFGNLDCTVSPVCVSPLVTFSHLLYDWNDDDNDGVDNGPFDDNPSGRIDFGLFKGPDEFIYIREPW